MGLAALSLLAEAGENRPLVCLVDDAQWLDQASALTLEFVARRLLAESVLIVFAVRTPSPGEPLAGLPELLVTGLSELDSRTLLDRVVIGPLDDQVRERVVAEAHGNPLALLELPRGRDAAQIAGFGRPDAQPLAGEIEEGFLRRVEALPVEARRLLVTAAAEPVGDGMLLRRAAERLGIAVDTAVSHVEASELITIGARIRFRHPLVRSAAYRAAGAHALREVHQALAEVTDGRSDPDRRAWHLACAAQGPDDAVADELERSAGRAQARGGVAAAAALLRSAAELTGDPARRARRTVDAAQATVHAGAFGPATTLLARAESGPLDEFLRARVNVLQAQIAFAVGRGKEAPPLLLAAARRLERFDVALARETHLEAVSAVIFAGHLAHEPGWREVGEVARAAPPAPRPRASDLLLDALAVRLTDGYSVSAPMIERVLDVFSHESVPVREAMRWLLLAGVVAADLWDLERWRTVATRHVTITRESGALSDLPLALDSCAVVHVFAGELAAAASVIDEVRTVSGAIGAYQPPFGELALAAVRGREREARTLIDRTISGSTLYGQGLGVTVAHSHHAVLCNGLAKYAEAAAAAQAAARHQEEFGAPRWALTELVEAAARSGARTLAHDALEQLSETTRASGTDWALGAEARSRALLTDGVAAEDLYREAIERLGRTRVRVELARARLLYGEWLRRENRRLDAREQLGTAYETLTQVGAEAFSGRARRELRATGATVRRRSGTADTALTSQEAQIARLAADGLTNPEIGAQLFLSRHTVEWHLRSVFSKLGIASRNEIRTELLHGVAS